MPRFELLRHDIRLAARSLSRSPVFVITTVFSIALGIGASAAAFSVLAAVRLRALPFPNGDRLVVIQEVPTSTSLPSSRSRGTRPCRTSLADT